MATILFGRFKSVAWWLFSLIIFDVGSQVTAKLAISNIAEWLHDDGWPVPAWLDSSHTDSIVRWIVRSLMGSCVLYVLWPLLSKLIFHPFRRETPFELLVKTYGTYGFVRAEWGEGVPEDSKAWLVKTINKRQLLERVKYLLSTTERIDAVKANHANLEMPPEFLHGIPKKLKLTYPDGSLIVIHEGNDLRLDSETKVSRGYFPLPALAESLPSQHPIPEKSPTQSIAGIWEETGGALVHIAQDRGKWTGKCSYSLKGGSIVEWEISDGTIGSNRKISGTLYHTCCPSDWKRKQIREGQLSADGGKITGTAIWEGGGEPYTWTRSEGGSPEGMVAAKQTAEAPHLSVLTDTGLVPLTEKHPVWVHIEAIKTTAAILREALEKIEQAVDRHKQHIPAAGTDQIWIHEAQQLDQYHDMRIALLREVQQHLPEIRVPILADFSRAWRWNFPLPDRDTFVVELQNIEHHANLKSVQLRGTARPATRYISDNQRKILAARLSHLHEKYDVIRVGYTDDAETLRYCESIVTALASCRWSGWLVKENIPINFAEIPQYDGISLFSFGHEHMPAMLALKDALVEAGIKIATPFTRPQNRPGNPHVIEIVVGPATQPSSAPTASKSRDAIIEAPHLDLLTDAGLVALTENRTEFNSLKAILDKIPKRCPPTAGGWHDSYDSANAILRSQVEQSRASFPFTVELSGTASRGGYTGTTFVLASIPISQTNGWKVLLYAYFEGVDDLTVKRILSHIKYDRIEVSGQIKRADFEQFEHQGVCLTIDLNGCSIVSN
jgi:hypothetical protein